MKIITIKKERKKRKIQAWNEREKIKKSKKQKKIWLKCKNEYVRKKEFKE